MNLFEYIKSQLPSMPNVAIMKDMDASDELIEYIRNTTWNTNLGMLAAYGCEPEGGSEPTSEIWASGAEISLYISASGVEGDGTTTKNFTEWSDLITNSQNYMVSVVATFPTVEKHEVALSYNEGKWDTPQSEGAYNIEAHIDEFDESTIHVYTEGYYHDETSGTEEDATMIEIIITKN